MTAEVGAQNAASPAPSCATVVPLADTVKDGYAECCFVEHDRVTRGLDPQRRLDTHDPSRPTRPGGTMKGRKYTPEQIVRKLREGRGADRRGKSLGEVAKALEVSDYTYPAGATSTAA
jgi:hypothetical protein